MVKDGIGTAVFKISRKTDYAVRVMLALAVRPREQRVATPILQEETRVPLAFLQRIVVCLRKAKLLHSLTGPGGGLQLAREPGEVTLLDIYQAVEGPLCVSECIESPQACPLSRPCPVLPRWRHLQQVVNQELARTSLSDLAVDKKRLAKSNARTRGKQR